MVARRHVHYTLRGSRVFAARVTTNSAQTECALVVRRRVSSSLRRARVIPDRAWLAHIPLALPFSLAGSSDLFRRDVHGGTLHTTRSSHRLDCTNRRGNCFAG